MPGLVPGRLPPEANSAAPLQGRRMAPRLLEQFLLSLHFCAGPINRSVLGAVCRGGPSPDVTAIVKSDLGRSPGPHRRCDFPALAGCGPQCLHLAHPLSFSGLAIPGLRVGPWFSHVFVGVPRFFPSGPVPWALWGWEVLSGVKMLVPVPPALQDTLPLSSAVLLPRPHTCVSGVCLPPRQPVVGSPSRIQATVSPSGMS